MNRKYLFLLLICLITIQIIKAQEKALKPFGFVDLYYSYSFNNPDGQKRLYTTQTTRDNEFQLNWGFFGVNYEKDNIRANFAMHTGTYVEDNYGAETELFRHLYLANVGYQLADNLWLDVGVDNASFALESPLSIDNIMYSRSMSSDLVPYYFTGVYLTYDIDEILTLRAGIVNGYQLINETNRDKSLNVFISYHPSDNFEIAYSNYIGNDEPEGSPEKYRYFNDMYIKYKPFDNFEVNLTGQYHVQDNATPMGGRAETLLGVLIMQYEFTEEWAVGVRGEYLNDPYTILMVDTQPNDDPFYGSTSSLVLNYRPEENIAFRIESKYFWSEYEIFPEENTQSSQTDAFIVISSAFKF